MPRWCGRIGFVRELWSGRPRVILDVEIEASLREPRRLAATAHALLVELVPERSSSVWLLADRPGDLPGPRRRGVHPIDEFEGLLAETPWEVALLELSRCFVDSASLSRFAARARGRLENRLETRAFRLLSALAEGAAEGRTVIVSAPAASRGGLALADFQDLLEQHFPRARVYALARVPVAVVVDCGEVIREDEDEGDAGEDREDDDAPPPLAFDNRLGEDLRYDTYVALINAQDEPLGVTLVELPAEPGRPDGRVDTARADATRVESPRADATRVEAPRADGARVEAPRADAASRPDAARADVARVEVARAEPMRADAGRLEARVEARPADAARSGRAEAELENLRIQLGQARRQVELAAIARQSLVEQLDAAQARVDTLEDQVAELQRQLAAVPAEAAARASEPATEPAAPAVDPRPDATQAALQTLRWELEQTREELRKALGRPVDALEREVAELRARLGATDPS